MMIHSQAFILVLISFWLFVGLGFRGKIQRLRWAGFAGQIVFVLATCLQGTKGKDLSLGAVKAFFLCVCVFDNIVLGMERWYCHWK